MRVRMIKPGFWANEELAEVPFEGRLLFIGLWNLADREGRLEDRPRRIKAALFPYDALTGDDVDRLLDELAARGFIDRYEVSGARYIQVRTFKRHQHCHVREPASTLPPPPDSQPIGPESGPPSDPVLTADAPRRCPLVSAMDGPGQSGASTVPAPDEHRASTGSAPVQHRTGPSAMNQSAMNQSARGLNPNEAKASFGPDIAPAHRARAGMRKARAEGNGAAEDTGGTAPFALLEALCEELGTDVSELPSAQRGKQCAAAKRLLAAGVTEHDVRRMTQWLASQSWLTGGIDLMVLEKYLGRWQLAGRPDRVMPRARSPARREIGLSNEDLEAIARGERGLRRRDE